MAPEIATHDSGTDDGPTITDLSDRDVRDVRALTGEMSVLDSSPTMPEAKGADDLYVVITGDEYLVDLREGACTCPDAEFNLRGGEQCKHEVRARFATGDRPIPAGVNHDEINWQLGAHIKATPTVVNADGEVVPTDCCWQRD